MADENQAYPENRDPQAASLDLGVVAPDPDLDQLEEVFELLQNEPVAELTEAGELALRALAVLAAARRLIWFASELRKSSLTNLQLQIPEAEWLRFKEIVGGAQMTTDKALRRHVSAAEQACAAWKVPIGEPCYYQDGPTLVRTAVRSKPFTVCGEAVILIAASSTAVPLRLCSAVSGGPNAPN